MRSCSDGMSADAEQETESKEYRCYESPELVMAMLTHIYRGGKKAITRYCNTLPTATKERKSNTVRLFTDDQMARHRSITAAAAERIFVRESDVFTAYLSSNVGMRLENSRWDHEAPTSIITKLRQIANMSHSRARTANLRRRTSILLSFYTAPSISLRRYIEA